MGFWDSLFRNNWTNNMSQNNITFPAAQKTTGLPDFDEEYASELYTDGQQLSADHSYSENGISLKDTRDVFKLTYNGILAKSGAQDVYAVIGYGRNDRWEDIKTYPMQAVGDQSFELLFSATTERDINIAFKDGADHWDNNSGRNYVYSSGQGG